MQVNAALQNEELTEEELSEMAIFLTHYVGFPLGSQARRRDQTGHGQAQEGRRRAGREDKKDNVNDAVQMHWAGASHDK